MLLRALGASLCAALVALSAGCRDERHQITASDARAPATSASTPAPAASAAPATIASGPCQGKRAGQMACDGLTLATCDDREGKISKVKTCFDIERCDADKGECAPACPEGSVYIPPTGPEGFVMGRGLTGFGFGSMKVHIAATGIADTPHKVVLTKPFCMDANEVTVAEYAKCVEEKGCTKPDYRTRFGTYPKQLEHPVCMVDWKQSKHFCESVGKTLPTEAQWEWAATGSDRRKFPWGDEPPTCEHADFSPANLTSPACDCGCAGGGPSPVGSHPKGDKIWPTGRIHDLAGNVFEWTLDNYAPYKPFDVTDPMYWTNEDNSHVVRGGGWNRSFAALTTAFRGSAIVGYQRPGLGARCIKNPS